MLASLLVNIPASTYIFDHMAVITNEEKRPAIWKVQLHANKAVSVSRKMMKSLQMLAIAAAKTHGSTYYPLAEINSSIVECLPIEGELWKVSAMSQYSRLQLHTYVHIVR